MDEWKKLITDFNNSVNKSLAEIRDCKRDIEKMKVDLMNEVNTGQYFRDEDCIVISSPRIIIGNVNRDGHLKEEAGQIIIRGHALEMDGVGNGAKISMNAPLIEQQAMDTGLDGKEEVVYAESKITSRARTIVLDSQNPVADENYESTFMSQPLVESGIVLNADQGVSIMAAPTHDRKKEWIEETKMDIDTQLADKLADISAKEEDASFKLMRLSNILSNEEQLKGDDDLTRTNILALEEIRKTLKGDLTQFNKLLLDYAAVVSEVAELTRKKNILTTEGNNVDSSEADYKESTNASIYLQSEHITMFSMDGDDNWRTNEGAGVEVRANNIKLHSTLNKEDTFDEVLTPPEAKGRVDIQARNVSISTSDTTDQQYTEDYKLQTGKFPLVGNVTIRSKIIDLESVDLAQTDETGKLVEEKLTEGSQINMRAEKVRVKTIDHEGKSVGKFSVNSQKISMKATNIDGYKAELELDDQGNRKQPDTMPSKELTPESEMLLLAEKMRVGYKKNKMLSKELYLASEEKLVAGSKKETIVATDKAHLILKEDASELVANGASTLSASGGTTVKGDTTFKGKVTGGDIVADNLTANKAVKAPNLTDGMVMSGASEKGDEATEIVISESNI